MKAVILAGGRGTRIAEETSTRPKPMVEIGGRPILWHIMKMFAHHGVTEFIVCLGYKGYVVKEFFANYVLHGSDVTIDLARNEITHHATKSEPWKVTMVDTGLATNTGGRIRCIRPYLEGCGAFCMTYGDGVSDIDIGAEIAFHRAQDRLVTMTVVRPPARFGSVVLEHDTVASFSEKRQAQSGMINGGFFVIDPKALDRIPSDSTSWEYDTLPGLVADENVAAWRHDGFWQPMDTLRDKELLEELWASGKAPWKVWA